MSDIKQQAIRILHRMFGIQQGASNGMVEEMVDCIINAAVAEIKATDKESLSVQTATTEQFSAVRKEVQR